MNLSKEEAGRVACGGGGDEKKKMVNGGKKGSPQPVTRGEKKSQESMRGD